MREPRNHLLRGRSTILWFVFSALCWCLWNISVVMRLRRFFAGEGWFFNNLSASVDSWTIIISLTYVLFICDWTSNQKIVTYFMFHFWEADAMSSTTTSFRLHVILQKVWSDSVICGFVVAAAADSLFVLDTQAWSVSTRKICESFFFLRLCRLTWPRHWLLMDMWHYSPPPLNFIFMKIKLEREHERWLFPSP